MVAPQQPGKVQFGTFYLCECTLECALYDKRPSARS